MELFNSRYELFDYLIKRIGTGTIHNKINCLDKSSGSIFELFYYDRYQYKLSNLNIFLIKVIGEQSLSGTIYLSKYKNYKFITKIILLNKLSIKELEITQNLSTIAYKNKNIHLPLLYGHSLCNKLNIDVKLADKNDKYYKYYNPDNSYYCLFIELYEASMYILLKKLLDFVDKTIYKELIYNIIIQCFISILSCHINNIYHNDIHINNFLYSFSKLETLKYLFEYQYKDLNFYLKSYPFIITICDFGISDFKENENENEKKFKCDYIDLLNSLKKSYIDKFKLNDIINLDLFYNLLHISDNDYDLFKKLKENNLFIDIDINIEKKKNKIKIII